MPEVRFEEEGRPNRAMIGWGDFDLWAMRNNQTWYKITKLACHLQLSEEERLQLLAYHLLKQNQELLDKLIASEMRNPARIVMLDPQLSNVAPLTKSAD